MENSKRPDHPDFMTTAEIKEIRFSGVRNNSLSNYIELWVEGEMMFDMAQADIARNQNYFNKKYAEVFGLHDVKTEERK